MTEEVLDKKLLEFKQELLKPFSPSPEFEVGKWYKHNYENKFLVFLKELTSSRDGMGYGFGADTGAWYNEGWRFGLSQCRPATKEEVQEALINEAEKRGFKEGVIVKESFGGSTNYKLKSENWIYYSDYDFLRYDHNCIVYEKGKWATIVKEEPIKIGGYEVKFLFKDYGETKFTQINGHVFTKEFWQAAKIVAEHSKGGVNVGCSKQFPVSLQTINQILDKLK
jgi:hypothetical protein